MKITVTYDQDAVGKLVEHAATLLFNESKMKHFEAEKKYSGPWEVHAYDDAGWAEKLEADAAAERSLQEYRAEQAAKKKADAAKPMNMPELARAIANA